MPTVAEQLRHGREAMNLDVHRVAEATKLKTDQIRALEQGNYDYFTAAVYLRGSVRTYANLLKLDAPALIAQLDTELGASKKFADDTLAPPRKKSGVDSLMLLISRNWGIAAVIIVVVLVGVAAQASYRAWKDRSASDPLKKLGAEMYQPAEASGETLPLPTNASRRP
jgi:cytoskeletal protein RodZ